VLNESSHLPNTVRKTGHATTTNQPLARAQRHSTAKGLEKGLFHR
jgi:hypothetical protein